LIGTVSGMPCAAVDSARATILSPSFTVTDRLLPFAEP
jgi:hypothetical protein